MDFLYSSSLLISLLAGGAAVLAGLLAMRGIGPRWLVRAGLAAVAVAALSLAVSVAVHRHWGHGPHSVEPMDVAHFASSHTAFGVAGAVIMVGLVLVLLARRRG